MAKLNTAMDAETFRDAAEAQKSLIVSPETDKNGLGSMTKERWQSLIQQLVDLNVIQKEKAPAADQCYVWVLGQK